MGMWAGLIAYCRRGFYPAALWVGQLSSASHSEIPLVVSLSNHFCSSLTTARSFDRPDKSRLSTLVRAQVERVGDKTGLFVPSILRRRESRMPGFLNIPAAE